MTDPRNDMHAEELPPSQDGGTALGSHQLALPPPEPMGVPPLHLPGAEGQPSVGVRTQGMPTPAIPGYEIMGELGHGGMGVVYKARQLSLDRVVALKMIRGGDLATADDLARFKSEAEAVARLKHPNIVQIYEVAQREGRPYLALEYVEGGDLAQKTNGIPQPPRAAAELVETLARAVHAAHLSGIVHRDLKPANILLQEIGVRSEEIGGNAKSPRLSSPDSSLLAPHSFSPKITDFGLAKRLDLDAGRTQTGAVMGTPSYMAPEQAAGRTKEIGLAADIYSLGAIFYELLIGRPPFQADSWEATRELVLTQEAVPPRHLQPKLPRDLQTICLKCLDKEARKRYASALELADELRCYLDGRPIRSRPVGAAERLWRWSRRKPALAGLSVLAALTLAAGIVVFISFALFTSKLSIEERKREASKALEKAISLCEQGEVGQGMLWLARSLELAPENDDDLERVIRSNLAGWGRRMSPLKAILRQEDPINYVTFSREGKTVLTASSKESQLWDAATGELRVRLLPHKGQILAAVFSSDGKTILTRSEDQTQIWDATTGSAIGPAVQQPYEVSSASFCIDGQKMLTGNRRGKIAQLWQVSTVERLGVALSPGDLVYAVALSPDGKKGLIGRGSGAQLWDLVEGKRLGQLGPEGNVYAVAFSADGRRALTGSADAARLWDVATREPIGQPLPHQDVSAVAFGPDGLTILTGSKDKSARLWSVETGKSLGTPLQHRAEITSVAFGPDGKSVVTGAADKTARIWGVPEAAKYLLQHGSWVHAVAYSPDGKTILTGSKDKTGRLWEAGSGREGHLFQHEHVVWRVAFSPDGKMVLTGSFDKTARLWNAATGKEIWTLPHDGYVWSMAFSPDGKTVLTGSVKDKAARLWNTATGEQIGTSLLHGGPVLVVAFSPNGKIFLTGSEDTWARLGEISSGKEFTRIKHGAMVLSAVFNHDGTMLLTGTDDGQCRLWNPANGNSLLSPFCLDGSINAVAFSPDGRSAAAGGAGKVARLWDTNTGEARGASLVHRGEIRSLAFSPDGRTLLTGSEDYTARLWDAATGKPIGPPLQHPKIVRTVAFGPDGRSVLTGCDDGKARVWEVPPPMKAPIQRLLLWTTVISGLELNKEGGVSLLDIDIWQQRRQLLQDPD
jgi:WD40 repeat protein/serine/threonine protein kinase